MPLICNLDQRELFYSLYTDKPLHKNAPDPMLSWANGHVSSKELGPHPGRLHLHSAVLVCDDEQRVGVELVDVRFVAHVQGNPPVQA